MQKKLLYFIHKLLGFVCLFLGTCNVYSLSGSYLLAGFSLFGMTHFWNYIFEKYCPERKNLVGDFVLGKLSSEELLAKNKLLQEPFIHIRTCIYATFYFLTEALSRCQL